MHRVKAEGLVRVPGAITARTLITVDDEGRKQTTAYPGANHAFSERDLPREAFTNGVVIPLAAIVSMNADEAQAITGVEVRDRNSAFEAVRVLQERGAARIAIGAAQGRAIAGDGAMEWLENYDVDVIDTTGAGDAFAAGVAVATAEGRTFADACRFGHAAAALAVTVFGARPSLPARAAVEALATQPR